jgi:hypothetical protein
MTARPLTWRERGEIREKERECFTDILSFLERFSPHVEIQYIFYRVTFSPNKRESLYFQVSLSFSPPPQFLSI